jgi:hypothetical protein
LLLITVTVVLVLVVVDVAVVVRGLRWACASKRDKRKSKASVAKI